MVFDSQLTINYIGLYIITFVMLRRYDDDPAAVVIYGEHLAF